MGISNELSNESLKTLASNVVRLSYLLTREREILPAAYLKDRGLREAYQAYFLPPNLEKIQVPLAELDRHPGKMLVKEKLRILDLGCGPGTASLGVLEFFAVEKNRPLLEFIAVEQVAENLKIAEELFNRGRHDLKATLKTVPLNIENVMHLNEKPFDLIILSNSLNELFAQGENPITERISMMKDILRRFLAEDGSCIIIEPALRETSRDLLKVRDGLLEYGFGIYAPCFCKRKCPALTNPRDWCHEDIPWDPPALIGKLDKLTGLRKDSLKFSYVVLRKDGKSLASLYNENAFRVVSEPLISKGKIEFYLCGENGRRLVTRLDKDRTSENDSFGKLQRGDVVGFERLIDESKRFKVGKETVVAKKSSRSRQRPA
ncbi:MAG: small ribosomal subunit Rsm22 family protein [Betaproteobacteria bacterium]